MKSKTSSGESSLRRAITSAVGLLFFLLSSAARLAAQESSPTLVTNAPAFGTFYWLSGLPSVPYPFDPARGLLPIWSLNGSYYVDDFELLLSLESGGGMFLLGDPSPSPGGTNGATNYIYYIPTNFTVGYFSNANVQPVLGIAQTTNPWIALTIQASNITASYDVFGTTNLTELALPSLSRTNWTWLTRANGSTSNFTWGDTNWCERYFQLGTMVDGDNDGLTDAYEQLVSKTATNGPNSPRAFYEGVISNQSPSAWFKLNDASLTNAVSGHPMTTLTNGGGSWGVDAFAVGNSAFSFTNATSNNDRLTAGDVISGGSGTNQGSISLLFRSLTGLATTRRYVFWQEDSNNSNRFGVFFEDDNGGIHPGSLCVQIGGRTNSILGSNAIVFGAWHYLALTWNESNRLATWYLAPIDGTLSSGTINLVNTNVGNGTTVYLGNNMTNRALRSPGNGALDEIAFWSRALTNAEVNAQFNTLTPLLQGPSKAFDLTRWELALPVDNLNQLDNSQEPLDVSTAWLNSGFRYVDPTNGTQKYFYLSNGSEMVFEAPWNGADQDTNSPGAKLGSPRSELRETLTNGSDFNWKPYDSATGTATNTHTLQATCRLESVPDKVIFGQIHADTPEPTGGAVPAVTLFHDGTTNNRIKLAVYYSPDRSVTNTGGIQTLDIVSGVKVGDRIDYELKLEATTNGTVTLYATVSTNGTPFVRTVHMSNPADPLYAGWAATDVTLYFKAGCYYPTAATNSGTARVSFSSLGVTHQP